MVGSEERYEDLGPGLHVMRESDPLSRAGTLAVQLRAELCATTAQVDAALISRRTLPALDADGLAALRVDAARLSRAHRLAARTRSRALAGLRDRQREAIRATGADAAIRARADEVLAARVALEEIDRELAAQATSDAAVAAEWADKLDVPPPAAPLPAVDPAQRARRLQSVGALLGASGLGLVVFALGLVPLWLALVPLLLACLWAIHHLRPRPEAEPEVFESTARLREMSEPADEVSGPTATNAAGYTEFPIVDPRRARAVERLDTAERAWREVAGEDADPSDVDSMLGAEGRPRLLEEVAAENVNVQVASLLLDHAVERWSEEWRRLGRTPPEPDDAESAVERLAADLSRPAVLVGPAAERAHELAELAPAAPIVVLEGDLEDGGVS